MRNFVAVNPFLTREWRTRWRDWRAYSVVFLCVGALAAGVMLTFWSLIQSTQYWAEQGGNSAASVASQRLLREMPTYGRIFFVAAMPLQTLLWGLIGTLLTAGVIARERERGLLESLQLSPLSAFSQIWARWLSASTFLAFVQILTLPPLLLMLFLGGVAPGELALTQLVVWASGALGAALGLWISARAPRPLGAIISGSVAHVAIFGAVCAIWVRFISWWPPPPPWWIGTLFEGIWFYPAAFCLLVVQLDELVGGAPTGFPLLENLRFSVVAVWIVLLGFMLVMAARGVQKRAEPTRFGGRSRELEAWSDKVEERAAKGQVRRLDRAARALTADVRPRKWRSLPLEHWVRVQNPILQRELRSKLRFRQVGFLASLGRVFAVLLPLIWIVFAVTAQTQPGYQSQEETAFLWFPLLLLLSTLWIGTGAALSFVRERDGGTWEGLRLSTLPRGNIVWGKWAAPLAFVLVVTAPLWIVVAWLMSFHLREPYLLLSLSSALAWLCWVAALGLWVSWKSKKAVSAVLWTFGLLFASFWGLAFAAEGDSGNEFYRLVHGQHTTEQFRIETGVTVPQEMEWGQWPSGLRGQQTVNAKRFQAWQQRRVKEAEVWEARTKTFFRPISPYSTLVVVSDNGRMPPSEWNDGPFLSQVWPFPFLALGCSFGLCLWLTRSIRREK